jgi:heat shock protein HtpX
MALFAVLILGLAYAISFAYEGSSAIIPIAAIIVIVQGFVAWNFSSEIAILSSQAIPLREAATKEVADRVERLTTNLCIAAGLPMPRLYVIPDTAMNAFASGKNKDHAVVAVTAGLVDALDDNELSGVIAHELAHIGNEDIKLMGVVMVLAGLVALISDFFLRSMFFGGNRKKDGDGGGVMILIALALAIIAPLFATLIQLAISRKREFMADATAVLITRYPEGLISALQKISGDTEPLEVANRGNAFMYFSNPLRGQWLAGLFATHPPVEQRIEALEKGTGMRA